MSQKLLGQQGLARHCDLTTRSRWQHGRPTHYKKNFFLDSLFLDYFFLHKNIFLNMALPLEWAPTRLHSRSPLLVSPSRLKQRVNARKPPRWNNNMSG